MEGKAPMKTSWKAYKSRNEGRMNEEWMKNDEGWMLKDDDFKLLRGFADWLTDEQTDICECRVAFATENSMDGKNI